MRQFYRSGMNIYEVGATATTLGTGYGYDSIAKPSPANLIFGYVNLSGNPTAIARVSSLPVGIAKTSASAGSSVDVVISGVADGYSSLITGAAYYFNTDGQLTTTATNYKAGAAISTPELLLGSNSFSADQYFNDLVFANDFRITEATDYAGLIFKNQLGSEILNMNELGDLAISNDLSAQNLQITGDTNINGSVFSSTFNQTSTSLSQYYQTANVEDGSILSFSTDDTKPTLSSIAYDKHLFGVITHDLTSAMGLLTHEDGTPYTEEEMTTAGYEKVAFSGIAKVKVSAANGEIKRGDYITSSGTAGVGQKATKSGQVIGMALDNLTSSEGLISVQLSPSYYDVTLEPSTTITAETIISPDLKDLTLQSSTGKTKLVGDLEVSKNLNITGDLVTSGATTVTGTFTANEKATFAKDIEILGHIIGNHDTRGTISIPAGQTEAEFTFATSYLFEPNIVALQKISCTETINDDNTKTKNCSTIKAVDFALEINLDKFIIHLATPQTTDMIFVWQAQQ